MHPHARAEYSNLFIAQEERLELPAIFSPSHGGSAALFGLPEDVEQDHEKGQFLTPTTTAHLRVSSMPTPPPDPFFLSSPISQDDISDDADISQSPAAMFLSSFSPSVPAGPLPDDEGEAVCGYTLGPIIAYGGFSVIRRAFSTQGEHVAIKIVRHSDLAKHEDPDRAKKHLAHEAAVWSSLCHENILPLFTSSHTSFADFFVTLYCPAGSLFDVLKRDGHPGLPQDEAARMLRQVVKGLRYLHEVAGYVHGDMKLENVLVDEMGVCRITDFGMARRIGECESDEEEDARLPAHSSLRPSQSVRQRRSRSRQPALGTISSHLSLLRHHSGPRHRNSSPLPAAATPPQPNQIFQPGSLPYASPELLLPSSSAAPYRPHPAQDVWALGVMLFLLLSGRLPFSDSFEPRLQMKILHGAYDVPQGIGRWAERVFKGCLQRAVHDRWTIVKVDEILEWGDGGDEASSPVDNMPPRAHSLNRNPPTVHENAVLDEAEASTSHRQDIDGERRTSTSRSRSSRSRSRTAAYTYHPYTRDSPAPHDPPQPSFAGLSDAIMRSLSSSSSGSGSCTSPVDSALVVTPSVSARSIERERGRAAKPHRDTHAHPPSAYRSVSRSGSPPSAPLTPLDVGYRGRDVNRTLRASLDSADGEKTQLPQRWMSPTSAETGSRSASFDPLGLTRGRGTQAQQEEGRAARSESMPPASWSFKAVSKSAAGAETTSAVASGMSSRSRSVVDSGRGSQGRGRRL